MKCKKRLLSVLLALCMPMSVLQMPALADASDSIRTGGTDDSPAQYVEIAVPHSHPVCGGTESCTNPDHADSHGGDLTYQPWPATTDAVNGGNYYLNGNITLTGAIEITGNVNLCLNGYSITGTDIVNGLFQVKEGGNLTICDCQGTGSLTAQGINNPVILYGSGVFNLYGGKISAPNTAIGTTGATGAVNIYGGTVESTGNSHQGIRAGGGDSNFTVNISGGTISGCYAVNLGSFATLTLSGSPALTGTTADLCLYTAAGTTSADNAKVNATGYTGTSVTVEENNKNLSGLVDAYAIQDDESGHFTLKDDTNTYHYVFREGGYVISTHSHKVCGEVNCSHDGHETDLVYQPWTATSGTVTEGNYYLTNDIDLVGGDTADSGITITGDVNLCLNRHKMTSNDAYEKITVLSGASLTICDCSAEQGAITTTAATNLFVVNGTLNIYSGTLSSTNSGGSRLIHVENGGTVNVYGGTLTSNASRTVEVDGNGTANVYGGVIVNTSTSDKGHAIGVDSGSAHISGGTIRSEYGNAVYIDTMSATLSGTPTFESGADKGNIYVSPRTNSANFDASGYTGEATISLEVNTNTAHNWEYYAYYVAKVSGTNYDKFTMLSNTWQLVYDAGKQQLLIHNHSWSEDWESDSEGHWHKCTAKNCPTQKKDYAEHSEPEDDGDCTSPVTCETCGYVFTAATTHNYSYSATENVITEKCLNSGCTVHNETATITAPTGDLVYDGETAHNATVDYSTGWAGDEGHTISYTKDGNPTDNTTSAGNYTASITIGNVTANVNYTVAKAEQAEPEDNAGHIIDYKAEKITADEGYELSESNEATTGSGALDLTPGTDVYIRLKEKDNYNPSAWVAVDVPERPTAPEPPTVTQRTPDSITVTVVEGQEYKLDENGTWQDGGVFSGLVSGEYTIYTRVKAVTEGNLPAFASAISSGTTVSTVSATDSNTVAPGETIITTGDTTIKNENGTVTVTPEGGEEIVITMLGKDDSVSVAAEGDVTVPGGSTVQKGKEGVAITLPGGGKVNPNSGAVTPAEDGIVTIKDAEGNTTTITPHSGEAVTPNNDSTVTVPGGSTVQTGSGTVITIGTNHDGNATVGIDGSIKLPGNGTATVTEGGSNEFTVTVPGGGGAITRGEDGSVRLPGGSTVKDAAGNTTEIPENGGVIKPGGDLSYGVTVTFDSQEGTEVAPQTIQVNQTVTEPEAPTRGGYSFQG